MASRSLPDLVRQLLLARQEEEYNTVETLEIRAGDHVSYIRFLCAGQIVRFKVCASGEVTTAISIHTTAPRVSPLPITFQRNERCVLMDHEVRRTDSYLLRIVNERSRPISVTVEISANLRVPSLRTKIEVTLFRVMRFFRMAGLREPLNRVVRIRGGALQPERPDNGDCDAE